MDENGVKDGKTITTNLRKSKRGKRKRKSKESNKNNET
jgi:hypothetical protein